MDLEKLNRSYERAKQNLKNAEERMEELKKEITTARENLKKAEALKIKQQKKGDSDGIKRAEEKIKKEKEKIEKIKEEALLIKEDFEVFQEKIDKVISEIRENPEMQEHLEQVLAKRYSRDIRDVVNKKIKNEENKKEQEEKKIESYDELKKLIVEHKSMENYLTGMLSANHAIENLNEKLAKLDPIKDKDEINKVTDELNKENDRLKKNKDAILKYASKKKIKITEETLSDVMKNTVIDKKTNKVNAKASIDNTKKESESIIKKCDKQILKYNKDISRKEKAIENLGYRVPEKIKEVVRTNGKDGNTDIEKETEEKPKWWQFIKRFNMWRENRNVQSLPNPEEKSSKNEKNEFAASLKYQVVKDIAEQMKIEKLREVKQQEKEARTARKDEDEELNL